VYVNGESAGTIADAGQQAKRSKDEKWQWLGVFAMVQGEETTAYYLFQHAINRDGVIRGNFYNTVTDSAEPVAGSVDLKTQRRLECGRPQAPGVRGRHRQPDEGSDHLAPPLRPGQEVAADDAGTDRGAQGGPTRTVILAGQMLVDLVA
jgi:hypothetical protein